MKEDTFRPMKRNSEFVVTNLTTTRKLKKKKNFKNKIEEASVKVRSELV